jgi:acetyltransferase-like isoleucine patch superfamily enzyme
LRRDHRPYIVKRAYLKFQNFYVHRFLKPQLEFLGHGYTFIQPWNVEIFGPRVEIGNYANIIAARDMKIRLSVWSDSEDKGSIKIGNYCLISPGVRIGSGSRIIIKDNCMIAGRAYITDSDWHGIYNRISSGKTAPILIQENVWIGDSALICKGVTIGENSIIGAGSVVVDNVPPYSVAAGNPARIVNRLDPEKTYTKRSDWFSDPVKLVRDMDQIDKNMLQKNSFLHWAGHLLFPGKRD